MKRILSLLLGLILLVSVGCVVPSGETVYEHPRFTATLPDSFKRVQDANIVAFAPLGDPVFSSSITFYTTELNWYFDSFSVEEYANLITEYTDYQNASFVSKTDLKIDGYHAHRAEYSVQVDQGRHQLILYAIQADMLYFFVLLNLDTDSYVKPFDQMMETIQIHEA